MLSEIVSLLDKLQDSSTKKANEFLAKELNQIIADTSEQVIYHDSHQQINDIARGIYRDLSKVDQIISTLKSQLQDQVSQQSKVYLQDSYQLYEAGKSDTADYILNRQIPLTECKDQFLNRLRSVADWRFPGLVIRPGSREFVEEVVANDPLYIADTDYALLRPSLNRFNDVYQNRLRTYVINENRDNFLDFLPDGQLGLSLIMDFFEYRPIEILEKYFQELYIKTRSGGTVIFTFNNCDHGHGVRMCENHYRCYTPASMLKALLEKIGFSIIYQRDYVSSISWMEIQKNGNLSSIRAGQSLAKIIEKSK